MAELWTLVGTASTPADNGTNAVSPTVVTPPGSMQAGDLVWVVAESANTSGTISVSQAGGQTWTSLTQTNQSRNRVRCFHCRYNGTWSANPSWTMAGTANNIVRMLVFRGAYGTNNDFYVDTAFSSAVYSAPTTPFTVTIPTLTTTHDGALVILTWTSADDNTWGTLTNGFTAFSPTQVRNTSGTYDQSISNAYKAITPQGAVGATSQNQATLGGDAGTRASIAFQQCQRQSAAGQVISQSSSKDTNYTVIKLAESKDIASASSAVAKATHTISAAGSVSAASSVSAAATNLKINSVYWWLIKDPAVGGVAGPKVAYHGGAMVQEVSSYVVGTGTPTVTFNVEERTTPESAGTDVLAADQEADADGATTTTIDNDVLSVDSYLYLDISAKSGTPTLLSVTVNYMAHLEGVIRAAGASAATSVAKAAVTMARAAKSVVTSVATAVAKITGTILLAGSVAAASSTTAGVSTSAIHSAKGTSTGTSTAVALPTTKNQVYAVYHWLVKDPAIGGIAGPLVPKRATIVELSSYVTAATSVAFNVEERTSPESSGTNIVTDDQVADEDGTTTGTFANDTIDLGNYLYLDISAVTGTPGILSVTVTYTYNLSLGGAAGASASTTSVKGAASVLKPVKGSVAATSSVVSTPGVSTGLTFKSYNWLLKDPATGVVPGPLTAEDIGIVEVSGYIVDGTGISFNIQVRDTPETATSGILVSDLDVDADGNLTTSYTQDYIEAGKYIVLDIRHIDGTPTILSVSLFYSPNPFARGRSVGTSSVTGSATVTKGYTNIRGNVAESIGTTADFVRTRYVRASVLCSSASGAAGRVTIVGSLAGTANGVSSVTGNIIKFTYAPAGSSVATSSVSAHTRLTIRAKGNAASVTTVVVGSVTTRRVSGSVYSESHVTGYADWKSRAQGSSSGVSSAVASATIMYEKFAHGQSAGTSAATSRASMLYWLAKGSSAGLSSILSQMTVYKPASMYVKVKGHWRLVK